MSLENRKRMFKIIPISFIALIVFSSFYLIAIKPLSDTSNSSVYNMLRVDFGRDDVIKYTIDKELIKNNRILEYRSETFLSEILVMVPRQIWQSKPYPHYMYLTASILNTSIFKIPAGTTPSWYEMCISNFGISGMVIACVGLIVFCKIADSCNNVDIRYIWLLFIVILLTQGISGYVIYIAILALLIILTLIRKCRKDIQK